MLPTATQEESLVRSDVEPLVSVIMPAYNIMLLAAPQLLLRAYNLRDRLILGVDPKF